MEVGGSDGDERLETVEEEIKEEVCSGRVDERAKRHRDGK